MSINKKTAIFGGSFNPPGLHHRVIAEELVNHFDQVIIVPCGPRPDKPTTNDGGSIHRAVMVDMTFRGIPRLRVDLFDLEANTFTRTHILEERYKNEGELWHVVGSDMLLGGGRKESFIHTGWQRGSQMWDTLRFAVVERPGYDIAPGDLPAMHIMVKSTHDGASTNIRSLIFDHGSYDDLMTPEVSAYVRRYGLYRSIEPLSSAELILEHPRALVVADSSNSDARRIVEELHDIIDNKHPNCIVVVGGDGMMLRAIRQYWRARLPFFGITTGHRGFLLNTVKENGVIESLNNSLVVRRLPLLHVEIENEDGTIREELAFNDAWVERSSGQTAWLRVVVDDIERMPRVVADGILVATAQGSTAYARAMGGPSLPIGTPAFVMVGSHVTSPDGWRPVTLPVSSKVELDVLDNDKRPVRGYVDGVDLGLVRRMRVRASTIASAEVAFLKSNDIEEKRIAVQFPE